MRAQVPLALEAMQTEHEADRTTSLMMDAAEARAAIATGDMLGRLHAVVSGLKLDPKRMRANLDLSGGLIMAEAIMLESARPLAASMRTTSSTMQPRLPRSRGAHSPICLPRTPA